MNKKERMQIEEGDKKREEKREKRLQKIQRYLTDVLSELSPENAVNYDIKYKTISPFSSSPKYDFFLTPRSSKRKGYNVMHLYGEDINKGFPEKGLEAHDHNFCLERLQKGIEYLQTEKTKKKKTGGLEETLGIIIILSLFSGIFFISNSITGFIIANLDSSASNKIGISLVFTSLMVTFFWFKIKR
ncbi:hypothetical protein HYX17_01415 [Candidatus Woesearchaeota archaeon]|nr:hypothetical protein [Candidatus Woesearchaeota archaeon]